MENTYMVSKWALIRRNELVDIPHKYKIHPDFLCDISCDEFKEAFTQIHDMFYQLYTDMASEPERFGCPLYRLEEYAYFSKEARQSRTAPWNIFYFMLCVFACGELEKDIVVVDVAEFKKINQAQKVSCLIKALSDYGFIFHHTKNHKLPSSGKIEIEYPDNPNIVIVLSLVAKKVMNTQMSNVSNYFSHMVAFCNGFISWNYKILQDDFSTCELAKGCDYVADKMHSEADKEAVAFIDKVLTEKGYSVGRGDGNEGPSLRYYKGKSVYDFALTSATGNLLLELRIRNAEKCLEYLQECPERIVDMFRYSDQGCDNRVNGTCKYGVKYEFEHEEKWHCGCCGAPFTIYPVKENISHYIRLVELGNKR